MEEFDSILNRPKILNPTNQLKNPSRLIFSSNSLLAPKHTSSPSHDIDSYQQKLRKSYNFNTISNSKPIKTFQLTSNKSINSELDSFISYPSSVSPESTISSISSKSTQSNDNANINKIRIENKNDDNYYYKSKIYLNQSNINRIQINHDPNTVILRRNNNNQVNMSKSFQQNNHLLEENQQKEINQSNRVKRAMSTCINVANINKFIEPKVKIDASSTFKQPILPINSHNLPLSSFRTSLLIEKTSIDPDCESFKTTSMMNSITSSILASPIEESINNKSVGSSSDLYQLNKNKRWRSMYALRDSIRNLTSCVSSKASFINKKNVPTIKINTSNDYSKSSMLDLSRRNDEDFKLIEYDFEENPIIQSNESDIDELSYDYNTSMQSVKNCDYNSYIGTSMSYLKCKTSDNLYASNKKLDGNMIGNASNLLINNSMFKSCNHLPTTPCKIQTDISPNKLKFSNSELKMNINLHSDENRVTNNSTTSVNTIKKIKIKKKKNILKNQSQKETSNLTNSIVSNLEEIEDEHHNNNPKEDDLYDMIEKIQGDRLDNQRCELSQDYSVTKFFDDKYSLFNEHKMTNRTLNESNRSPLDTCSNRLEKIISNSNQYPMISLPDSDQYWCEGWKCDEESNFESDLVISSSSLSSPSSSSSSPSPSPSTESTNYGLKITCSDFDSLNDNLKDSYMIGDNLYFYGRSQLDQPFVLSYTKLETTELRAILRLKDTNYLLSIPIVNIEEPIQPDKIIQLIKQDLKIKFLYPLVNLNGFKLIKEFDNHSMCKNFKFGVIYMKKGQITEEELFSNQEHSEEFDNFLNILGNRIKLKDFSGFRGGLDTSHGQTGEYSVYEQYQDNQIMFHVSTLLPYNKNDNQQLERKRHIGNDIVAIIFQEDNTPFAPDMIASNFLHAFIVVQKFNDETSSKIKYKISVTARKDVPNFGPPISNDSVFESDSNFKEWLLNKLINAEYSCYKAEKFKKLKERTRSSLLEKLYNDLNVQNQSILNNLFPNLIENSLSQSTRVSTENNSALNSPVNTSSSHNLSNSTSFKFNLIHTVRRAFKKDSKEKDFHGSKTSLNKNRSGTISSPSDSPVQTPTTLTENNIITNRMRSMTFDSTTEPSFNISPNKYSLKNQASIQNEVKIKKKNLRYTASHEHHLTKIGSIDSLNHQDNENIDLKNKLFSLIPAKNMNSLTDLTNLNDKSYVSSSGSSSLPEDEIDERLENAETPIQIK
ncbi:unnamed protein product [Brachionus calyciflorus]|uniref:Rap-GAP domain-containing protein n=1 Tax=Brachionus calyciflorus TaxID=104777 RepID=A0A813STM8_9BILA|nr:unnamed protein product [Brachionus calyciflorus]